MKILFRVALALALVSGFLLVPLGCSTTYPRRDPTGEQFPSVTGGALSGGAVSLPEAFSGQPAVLFIGYKMDSQFDIDRWLMALSERSVNARVFEIPTIPGLFPGLFANKIDEGMRSGIPSEDWAVVVTCYEDAAATIAEFTGNETPLPARVLVLDAQGKVIFFHDRGFSVGTLERLRASIPVTSVAPK